MQTSNLELKKIYPPLSKALLQQGLTNPTVLQFESWATLKSGADCVLLAPDNSGKSTAIAMILVQKLQKAEGESTRALLLVNSKEAVLEAVQVLQTAAQHTNLRIYGVHEKGDIDYDKNQISLGTDILVGTPTKINTLFSGAGFNLNTVRIFALDDADLMVKNRQDQIILRLCYSLDRAQRILAAANCSLRFETLVEKITHDPIFFELDDAR